MKLDKKLLLILNQKLPITQRPFKIIAERFGMEEKQILSVLKKSRKIGLLRRFGVFLDHRKIGLKTNALIAWRVKTKKINNVARILTGFSNVSHCYLRNTYPFWPYNLYTMLHTKNKKESKKIIELMSKKTGVKEYLVMWTIKEFKKTRPDLKSVFKEVT